MSVDTSKVFITKLYPLIEKKFSSSSTIDKYKKLISRYIQERRESLYDSAPCDRIPFTRREIDELLSIVELTDEFIAGLIKETYYANKDWETASITDSTSLIMMCIIRFFKFKKKDDKLYELSIIFLACRMYPSIHYNSFKIEPNKNRHVMDYVVNKMLTEKYDLKTEGTVIGVLKSRGLVCFTTYEKMLKDFQDDDIVYILQQMRTRIGGFVVNIAKLFYDAYDNELYMTYDGDSFEVDSYHISDSNTKAAGRLIEKTINSLNSIGMDYNLILTCSGEKIKTNEFKNIMSGIISNRSNNGLIKELVTLIVVDYYANSKTPDCTSLNFLSYTLATKSNTKNDAVIRIKEILISLIETNSAKFRQTSREGTRNEYIKATLKYFTLFIQNNAKNVY
jgi:hypothetical protein